ncbi:FAS1-like dehydratase domain-containing protein [Amycolatopsis saalfeldensis]|uniref:3-methylfumaryl-CoA hydratase n=1 Tax=Amycolatopsis saalfeldensis TaxID=394193 RepID=A0A1H8VFE6_9PSEU|nr:MaoC family dehydratase N-terminal domain-containing protein [Amycolatopsis saalfeldensis]SEP14004.1 3-methylfumaryl-CoA hydratase [Amycolatopsis saalfeldensis]
MIEHTELIQPEPARALGALLDVPVPGLDEGLPLLWHWLYLLDRPAQADLGPDGHPVRNTVLEPPGPGRRRMWAGGRVRTRGVLRCGESATRRSAVLSTQDKQGRSGPLTFVTVGHRIRQSGRIVVDEEQDIVYRPAGGSVTTPAAGPVIPPETGEWPIEVTPTLLFRFSALTYNAHRIHFDRDYARDVEGYPGLLTHGPLQAIAMAEAARARGCAGDLVFDYRLVAPLFDQQGMIVSAKVGPESVTTAVRDRHGRRTAIGTLRSEAT